MNEKQKEILTTHGKFLIKNIVWTEELALQLQQLSLIKESTLKDVKSLKNRDDKISRILEQLPYRGTQAYTNFCDALQLSGHYFVADFLREEDVIREKYNTKELYQKLKFLEKLKDQEKKELEDYFLQKFREDSLRMVWKHDFRDKEKAMDAKRDQLDQHFTYEKLQKKQKEEVVEIEKQLQSEKEEGAVLRATISQLKHDLKEIESKRLTDVGAQLKYTQANESALNRTSKRLELAEKTLRALNEKIAKVINQRPRQGNERDEMELANYEFAFLSEDFDVVMDSYHDLLMVRRKYQDLLREKDYIMTHMGYDLQKENGLSLTDGYRDFVAKNDEMINELKQKMDNFQHLVEEQKEKIEDMHKDKADAKNKFQMGANVWQAAIMNVMRNQLQDVKKECRVKDSRIQMYENELIKMKNRVNELERERERMVQSVRLEKKNRQTVEITGDTSVSSDASVRDEDEFDGISEIKRESSNSNVNSSSNATKKQPLLPPLKQNYFAEPVANPVSPRKSTKTRQLGSLNKSGGEKYFMGLPDGLTTAPVRLENRVKYNTLPHGLGDLKNLHNQGKSKFDKAIAPPPLSKVRF